MRRWVVGLVVLVLATGCGGGGESSSPSDNSSAPSEVASQATAKPSEVAEDKRPVEVTGANDNRGVQDLTGQKAATVPIEMGAFYYQPTYIQVDPGTTLSLDLHNEDESAHTFTIDPTKISKLLRGGDASTAKLTMPRNAAVRFYCEFHPGMAGAFFSKDGQKVRG